MKLFIDTANKEHIKELASYKIISGVTTNPSLMAKEGISGIENCHNHYIEICNLVDGPVSAEVISTDCEGMLQEAYKLAELHPNIVIKIPMIKEGVKAIYKLTEKNIKTNCTLIFSANQAMIAAKAGATYVSPFIGRLYDINEDGLKLIESIRTIFDNYNYKTNILAASIRSLEHVKQCAELGSDYATIPYKLLDQLFDHPLTTKGLKLFLEDHARLNQ